jgi:hypothetical protein
MLDIWLNLQRLGACSYTSSLSQENLITRVCLLSLPRLTRIFTGEPHIRPNGRHHKRLHPSVRQAKRGFTPNIVNAKIVEWRSSLIACYTPVNSTRRGKEDEGQGSRGNDISRRAVRRKRVLVPD